MQIVNHVIGVFVFDKGKAIEKRLYKNYKDYLENKENYNKQIINKYPNAKQGTIPKSPELYNKLYEINKEITKEKLQQSLSKDHLISQSYSMIKETERIKNTLTRRLEEWYGLFLPELFEVIKDNNLRTELITKKTKEEIMKELNINESIGSLLKDQDLDSIRTLSKEIQNLTSLQEVQKAYLEKIMQDYCPNLLAVAEVMISAGLIEHTGSLRKLALLPSSAIQILGAEKALFRHLQRNTKPPKYGLILSHSLIAKAKDKAKAARKVAAAISKSAKIDYFHGNNYEGYSLKKKLEEGA